MNDIIIGLGFDPLIVSIIIGPLLSALLAALDVPSWTAHNDTLAALGKAISGSVEDAARRVVEEARQIAAPMPKTEEAGA